MNPPANAPSSTFTSQLEHVFGLRDTSRLDLFRQGFGLGSSRNGNTDEGQTQRLARAEEGESRGDEHDALETDLMIPIDPNDPQRSRLIAEALARDRRLQADLRSAGLL